MVWESAMFWNIDWWVFVTADATCSLYIGPSIRCQNLNMPGTLERCAPLPGVGLIASQNARQYAI